MGCCFVIDHELDKMVLDGHVERVDENDDEEEKIICRVQDQFWSNQSDQRQKKCLEEEWKEVFEAELNAFAHAEALQLLLYALFIHIARQFNCSNRQIYYKIDGQRQKSSNHICEVIVLKWLRVHRHIYQLKGIFALPVYFTYDLACQCCHCLEEACLSEHR